MRALKSPFETKACADIVTNHLLFDSSTVICGFLIFLLVFCLSVYESTKRWRLFGDEGCSRKFIDIFPRA